MSQTSVKLFSTWAAKHKEYIALQEQLERALRDGAGGTDALAQRVQEAKADAERLQDEALALFRIELRDRGLT